MSLLLECNSVYKSFGKKSVLSDLSLTIHSGDVFALAGLNGAGKTTVLRTALGLLKPGGGEVRICGEDASRLSALTYRKLGVVLDDHGFHPNLSVRENLHFFGALRGMSAAAINRYFDQWWANSDVGRDRRPVRVLSKGQKMQCALMRAFAGEPRLLLLDEPVASLDFEAYDRFSLLVNEARARGAACIISTHQLDLVDAVCTVGGILSNGRIDLLPIENGQNVSIRSLNGIADREIVESIAGPVRIDGTAMLCRVADETHAVGLLGHLVAAAVPIVEFSCVKKGLRHQISTSLQQMAKGGPV